MSLADRFSVQLGSSMPVDRYSRQRGLVVQDVIVDARIAIYGTGVALPYLLQCLVLMGVARRHGHIRLVNVDQPVTELDLAHQFLLDRRDLGRPLGEALADRVEEIDPAVVVLISDGHAPRRELVLAVPRADQIELIRSSTSVDVWGHVLPAAVFVGPEPPPVVAEEFTVVTAALGGVCGGLLAQAALIELGALVDGPAVVSSWSEERIRVVAPGIGVAARVAIASGTPEPDLRGVMERVATSEQVSYFAVHLGGQPVHPRVTTVIDDDEVLASVIVGESDRTDSPLVIRPARHPAKHPRACFWSPLEGTSLENGGRLPAGCSLKQRLDARIVMCGAGALGSWASAVLAASGAELYLCVVDMDGAVEAHNLNRQVLFTHGDIGKPKAVRTAERLGQINPAMRIDPLLMAVSPELLNDPDSVDLSVIFGHEQTMWQTARAAAEQRERLLNELAKASAILSCPDNQQTRWTLNVLAERLEIPLVNGAADGFTGRVHVCDTSTLSMCLVCWLGESIADDPQRRSCTDVVDVVAIQSIVTSAAIVGSVQAATLLLALVGAADRVRRFHTWDGTVNRLDGHRAGDRDPAECPLHLLGRTSAGTSKVSKEA